MRDVYRSTHEDAPDLVIKKHMLISIKFQNIFTKRNMFNNDADTNEDVVGTSEQVFVGEDYKEDDGSLNERDEG